ncbi:DUF2357 domain-containing protein, partial [Sphingomonas sp. PsM26]|nr:DUF2357 domain-containing protein [Sphingomonas sp. PsM26]
HQSYAEYITILQFIFDELIKSLHRIKQNPNLKIVQEQRVVQADRARKIDHKSIQYLCRHPHLLIAEDNNGVVKFG